MADQQAATVSPALLAAQTKPSAMQGKDLQAEIAGKLQAVEQQDLTERASAYAEIYARLTAELESAD